MFVLRGAYDGGPMTSLQPLCLFISLSAFLTLFALLAVIAVVVEVVCGAFSLNTKGSDHA